MTRHDNDRHYLSDRDFTSPPHVQATERPSDEMTDEEVEAWTSVMGAPPKSRSLKPIGHVEFGFRSRRPGP